MAPVMPPSLNLHLTTLGYQYVAPFGRFEQKSLWLLQSISLMQQRLLQMLGDIRRHKYTRCGCFTIHDCPNGTSTWNRYDFQISYNLPNDEIILFWAKLWKIMFSDVTAAELAEEQQPLPKHPSSLSGLQDQFFNTLRTTGKGCPPDSPILNCIFDNNRLVSYWIVWLFLELCDEVISNIFLVIFHSRDKKCPSPWSFPLSAGPIRHGAFCPSVYKWIFHDRLSFSVEGDDEDKDPSHFDEFF